MEVMAGILRQAHLANVRSRLQTYKLPGKTTPWMPTPSDTHATFRIHLESGQSNSSPICSMQKTVPFAVLCM